MVQRRKKRRRLKRRRPPGLAAPLEAVEHRGNRLPQWEQEQNAVA
jgi:hypothetical protein